MSKYHPFGENDPVIQVLLQAMVRTGQRTLGNLASNYPFDVCVATMLTAMGAVIGEFAASYDEHAKDCDHCAKKQSDFYELAVKNFGAAYGQAKADYEAETADLAEAADNFLDRIVREHKK